MQKYGNGFSEEANCERVEEAIPLLRTMREGKPIEHFELWKETTFCEKVKI